MLRKDVGDEWRHVKPLEIAIRAVGVQVGIDPRVFDRRTVDERFRNSEVNAKGQGEIQAVHVKILVLVLVVVKLAGVLRVAYGTDFQFVAEIGRRRGHGNPVGGIHPGPVGVVASAQDELVPSCRSECEIVDASHELHDVPKPVFACRREIVPRSRLFTLDIVGNAVVGIVAGVRVNPVCPVGHDACGSAEGEVLENGAVYIQIHEKTVFDMPVVLGRVGEARYA